MTLCGPLFGHGAQEVIAAGLLLANTILTLLAERRTRSIRALVEEKQRPGGKRSTDPPAEE